MRKLKRKIMKRWILPFRWKLDRRELIIGATPVTAEELAQWKKEIEDALYQARRRNKKDDDWRYTGKIELIDAILENKKDQYLNPEK